MPPPLLHCDEAGDATASCPSGGRRLSPVLLPISRAPPRALPPPPGIVPPLALPRDPQGCSLPDNCDASITGAPGEGEESHGGGMLEMFGRWLGSRSPRGPRNGMANEAAGMAGIASRRLHASPDNGHQLHREQEMLRESDCPHDVNPPLMPTTESEWRGAPFGDSVAGASGPSTMDDGYWNSVFSGTSSSLSPLRPEVMNLAGSLAPLHGSPSRAPKHHRPKGHDQNAFKWKPPPTPPHAAAAQPAALAGALWQALASPRGMRQRGFRRRYRPEAGDIDNDDRYSSADSSGDGPVAGGMVPELEFQESDFLLSPEDWAKLMAMQEEEQGGADHEPQGAERPLRRVAGVATGRPGHTSRALTVPSPSVLALTARRASFTWSAARRRWWHTTTSGVSSRRTCTPCARSGSRPRRRGPGRSAGKGSDLKVSSRSRTDRLCCLHHSRSAELPSLRSFCLYDHTSGR